MLLARIGTLSVNAAPDFNFKSSVYLLNILRLDR